MYVHIYMYTSVTNTLLAVVNIDINNSLNKNAIMVLKLSPESTG